MRKKFVNEMIEDLAKVTHIEDWKLMQFNSPTIEQMCKDMSVPLETDKEPA